MSPFEHSKYTEPCDGSIISTFTLETAQSEVTSSTPTSTMPTCASPQLINEDIDACKYCFTCGQEISSISPLTENDPKMPTNKNKNNAHKTKSSFSYIPITKCQLRQHNNTESGVWILCGTTIYDATNYIEYHPGGIKSIMRKAGGIVDCTRDMSFHSPQAVKLWKKMKIGYLVPCPGETNNIENQLEMLDQSEQCVIC